MAIGVAGVRRCGGNEAGLECVGTVIKDEGLAARDCSGFFGAFGWHFVDILFLLSASNLARLRVTGGADYVIWARLHF